ncbi:MAG: hypothetical protein IK102_01360 [Treponema sp.]|nr:hypothetical protein [Treponema sp.]
MKKLLLIAAFALVAAADFFAIDFNLTFDEGLSYAQVTRIEKLEDRSNFVRENMMAGAYFSMQTHGLPDFNFQLDISAYYPFYQAFNGMKQKTKNIINYAFDGYLGTYYVYDKIKYVNITASIGMHYMYQLTDEWHMHYLGLGVTTGIELPVSPGWTIVNRNYFSYDNANLGKNKTIQPFRASYQYHINLGVRYSRKVRNSYSYIGGDQ